MHCWLPVFVCLLLAFVFGISGQKQNVEVVFTQTNQLRIRLDPFKNSECEYVEKYNEDIRGDLSPSTQYFDIENLKPNTLYKIRARSQLPTGIFLEYSDWTTARTAPGEAAFSYISRQTFVILLLEQIPGATQWEVRYSALENDLRLVTSPNTDITSSYYVVVIRNLLANRVYSCSARVSQIAHIYNYDKSESGFGNPSHFITEPFSLFGSVVFAKVPYETKPSSEWLNDISTEIVAAYPGNKVKIIKVENNTDGNALVHHEVFLSEQNASDVIVANYQLTENAELKNPILYFDGTEGTSYFYGGTSDGGFKLYPIYPILDNRTWSDTRNWTIMNFRGGQAANITLPGSTNNETTNIYFKQRELLAKGKRIWKFSENTVNIIGHNYLVKYCPRGTKNTSVYGRIYTAANASIENQYTIVYSTGPGAVPTNDSMVGISPFATNPSGYAVQFTIPSIRRAVRYDFNISTANGTTVDSISVLESDIDSSSHIKVVTNSVLQPGLLHNLSLQVFTRLANGSITSSPISSLTFFAGLPKPTAYVIGVTVSKFTVMWSPIRRAADYVIIIRNSTGDVYENRSVAAGSTKLTFINLNTQGETYNASVAAHNEFGTSLYSDQKSTDFWNFREVRNSSFVLNWDNQQIPVDFFHVTTNLSTVDTIFTRNHFATVSGLLPGTLNQVTVLFNSTDTSTEILFQTTQYTVSAIPTNVTAYFNETDLSITINWDRMRGADSYELVFGLAPLRPDILPIKLYTPTYMVNTVSVDNMYTVSVKSINKGGISEAVVIDISTAPANPSNLKFDDITATSITVSWQPPKYNGLVEYWLTLHQESQLLKNFTLTSHNYNFANLQPGTQYTIKVATISFSPLENKKKILNEEGAPKIDVTTVPSPPTNLHVGDYDITSVTVTWDASIGATSYATAVSSFQQGKQLSTRNFNSTTRSIFVPNLNPTASWFVASVSAVNVHGFPSDLQSISLDAAARNPTSIRYEHITDHSISVSWNAPLFEGNIKYRLTVFHQSQLISNVTVGPNTKHVITNLSPGQSYIIRVATITYVSQPKSGIYIDSKGAPQISVTAVPAAPSGVVATSNGSHVMVTWSESEGAASYHVTVETKSPDSSNEHSTNYTTNDTKISFIKESTLSYTLSIAALNIHGFASPFSNHVYVEGDQSEQVCCGPVPWWAILAASLVMFIMLLVLLAFMAARHKRKESGHGSYTVQPEDQGGEMEMHSVESSDRSQSIVTSSEADSEHLYGNVNRKPPQPNSDDSPTEEMTSSEQVVNEAEVDISDGNTSTSTKKSPDQKVEEKSGTSDKDTDVLILNEEEIKPEVEYIVLDEEEIKPEVEYSNLSLVKEKGKDTKKTMADREANVLSVDGPEAKKTKTEKDDNEQNKSKENMDNNEVTYENIANSEIKTSNETADCSENSKSVETTQKRDQEDAPKEPGESSSSSGPRESVLLFTASVLNELDEIEFPEDLECDELQEGETVNQWKERLKFSLKGKPGKLKIVDRTFFEDPL